MSQASIGVPSLPANNTVTLAQTGVSQNKPTAELAVEKNSLTTGQVVLIGAAAATGAGLIGYAIIA